MCPNRLWADWQKYLYCFLSGTVMVTLDFEWYSNETHCDQSTGVQFTFFFNVNYAYIVNFFTQNY